MRASWRVPTRLRAAALLTVLILGWPGGAAAQKFYPDDPLDREPPPLPAIDPTVRNFSALLEAVSATFSRPGERQPRSGVIASQGVNTLGEVLNGPWFVNRHGRTRLSREELLRGSGDSAAPSMSGPWRVLLLRSRGARPAIVFRDAVNHMFILRFDPADAPEMATGAEMISSRVFHALGYYVPETYLVLFKRDRLVVESNASDITSNGALRSMLPEDIDRLLEPVARRQDGSIRAVALRVPTEGESLIGPFQFFGTRSDDPNDVVPHEHRRDLRGMFVFSAWLNHTHVDPIHTIDMVVSPEGLAPHIRHYLFDFAGTLGSDVTDTKAAWEGRDPTYGKGTTIRNMVGLGIYTPAWMRADYPDLPAVGRFEAKTFEPDKWSPVFDVAAFANRLPDDTFWAAKQVMAFSDADIRTLVESAQYSDPDAARWIAECLIDRRDRIGRAYFAKVLPLDGFAVQNRELTFTDLAAEHRFAEPRRYSADWWGFDNRSGKSSTHLGREGMQIPPEAMNAPAGSYILARIAAEGSDPNMTVRVFLRSGPDGFRVVGIDRDWPGRKLVDPRIVVAQVRNRYAELEPERQKLYAGYTQMMNARTGQVLSPEQRFRAMSPSEQTTFDGITHALMRATMTDEQGRPLGRPLDLVTGIERIAGQQAGKGGDHQFRLYATLRPDARETLEKSREFTRDEENTVYHPGYPHSYRLGKNPPSIQFSVAEDGLIADIDVDYRTSKAPKSLFNGHLTASNSDVRAGDNAQTHDRRWNGFVDWWSGLFGQVKFVDRPEAAAGPFGNGETRTPTVLPPNRPINASIPELADAVQEFLTDWVVRRNYQEAFAFFAPDVLKCVADSLDMDPKAAPDRLRRAGLELLEKSSKSWGRPIDLTEAMNPVFPWAPSVRLMKHAFEKDFTLVEAPTELGALYECGATPPKAFKAAANPEYGTYYGALLQVVREGQPGGTLVLVWRRLNGEWRLVAYRAVD